MPFRLTEFTTKIQFITYAAMKWDIYKACLATGTVSQTRYCQEAICERLSRDLDIPLENLLARLPECRGRAAALFEPKNGPRIGPGNTIEVVR